MTPINKFLYSFLGRLKYSIIPLIVLSVIVYYVSKSHYDELPRHYLSVSKLFPLKSSSESSSSPMGSYFGFPGSGSSGSGADNFYNLEELIKSRTIKQEIARRRVVVGNSTPFIFEYSIKDHNENPDNRKAKYKITNNFQKDMYKGAEYLDELITLETNESSFIKLTCKSYNEDFAVALADEVIDVLSDFYVQFNEQPLTSSFYNAARLKDSLEYELDKYERAYAKYLDQNKYVVRQEENINLIRIERKIASIEELMANATANYYTTKNKMDNNKPIVKVLDRPMKPLEREADKYRYYPAAFAILAFIFMLILSSGDLSYRLLNDSLQKQREKLLSPES